MANIDLSQLITAEIKTKAARQAAFSKLADIRWRHETGGVIPDNGIRVSTSRESQGQIASAVMAVQSGMIANSISWKTDQGWVELDGEAILGMAAQVSTHVQASFAAERIVACQIEETSHPAALDLEAAFKKAVSG